MNQTDILLAAVLIDKPKKVAENCDVSNKDEPEKILLRQIPVLTQAEVERIRQPKDLIRVVQARPERSYVTVPAGQAHKESAVMALRLFWLFGAGVATGIGVANAFAFRSV